MNDYVFARFAGRFKRRTPEWRAIRLDLRPALNAASGIHLLRWVHPPVSIDHLFFPESEVVFEVTPQQVQLLHLVEGHAQLDTLGVTETVCEFGGDSTRAGRTRRWAQCVCGARCAVVYRGAPERGFRCRACIGIIYTTTTMQPLARWKRKARAIARELYAEDGDAPQTPIHPSGRRMRIERYGPLAATYEELSTRIAETCDRRGAALVKGISRSFEMHEKKFGRLK